jgi:hypothetical protein
VRGDEVLTALLVAAGEPAAPHPAGRDDGRRARQHRADPSRPVRCAARRSSSARRRRCLRDGGRSTSGGASTDAMPPASSPSPRRARPCTGAAGARRCPPVRARRRASRPTRRPMSSEPHGIAFPADASGRRSTTAVGGASSPTPASRSIHRGRGPPSRRRPGAGATCATSGGRSRLGWATRRTGTAMGRGGAGVVTDRMVVVRDGAGRAGAHAADRRPDRRLGTAEVTGVRAPVEQLVVPYRGRLLTGDGAARPARPVGGPTG